MKLLPLQFKEDSNKTGLQTFKQLKREGDAALYERTTEERRDKKGKITQKSRVFGFEVFEIKRRFKGQALPGGNIEQEDREVYPGASVFGKVAYFCNSLGAAEERFEEIEKTLKVRQENKEGCRAGNVARFE